MKLIKPKLQDPHLHGRFQCPGMVPTNVFTWSYVFEKFAKVEYGNHIQLRIIEVRQAVN